jgi:HSP20 family protein
MVPAVSLYENDKEIVLEADVPGATADATKVHFDGNIMQFTARAPIHPDGRTIGTPEVEHGAWYRRFQLPDYAEGHQATSSLRNGVLSVRVPKSKAPRSHDIPVRAAWEGA